MYMYYILFKKYIVYWWTLHIFRTTWGRLWYLNCRSSGCCIITTVYFVCLICKFRDFEMWNVNIDLCSTFTDIEYSECSNSATPYRGVATLGSSRHVPTLNFHKILRKICIKGNVFIFLVFNVFSKIGNKIVIQLDLSSHTAFIKATKTTVIDQFIAQKNEFYLKQTKIKLCSVVGYYDFYYLIFHEY